MVFQNDTAATPSFLETAAEFKMWVSRIDDEDIREAASEFLDQCGEFETRLAESDHNWVASTVPVSDAESELIELTGDKISKLPFYLLPEAEENDHPDQSAG